MYRTITLRLNHRYEEDKEKLLRTMEAFAHAFNMSAEYGFEHKEDNKIGNSMAMYHRIRDAIPGLPGAIVNSACFMATEALINTKFKVLPKKSPTSSIRYTRKGATVNLENGYATIQVLACRVIATFQVPKHFDKYTGWTVRCSYLRFDKGTKSFYLNVAVENQEVHLSDDIGVLGIDRGLRNLAVCSNNKFFNSNEFKRVKSKNAFLRAQLQAKGTHSAKRKLKKLAGRERRFVASEMHRIAKEIVSMPYGTFVLEDLTGIRSKPTPKQKIRHDLTVWPYGEFKREIWSTRPKSWAR